MMKNDGRIILLGITLLVAMYLVTLEQVNTEIEEKAVWENFTLYPFDELSVNINWNVELGQVNVGNARWLNITYLGQDVIRLDGNITTVSPNQLLHERVLVTDVIWNDNFQGKLRISVCTYSINKSYKIG